MEYVIPTEAEESSFSDLQFFFEDPFANAQDDILQNIQNQVLRLRALVARS
jgi:hypothetical protein